MLTPVNKADRSGSTPATATIAATTATTTAAAAAAEYVPWYLKTKWVARAAVLAVLLAVTGILGGLYFARAEDEALLWSLTPAMVLLGFSYSLLILGKPGCDDEGLRTLWLSPLLGSIPFGLVAALTLPARLAAGVPVFTTALVWPWLAVFAGGHGLGLLMACTVDYWQCWFTGYHPGSHNHDLGPGPHYGPGPLHALYGPGAGAGVGAGEGHGPGSPKDAVLAEAEAHFSARLAESVAAEKEAKRRGGVSSGAEQRVEGVERMERVVDRGKDGKDGKDRKDRKDGKDGRTSLRYCCDTSIGPHHKNCQRNYGRAPDNLVPAGSPRESDCPRGHKCHRSHYRPCRCLPDSPDGVDRFIGEDDEDDEETRKEKEEEAQRLVNRGPFFTRFTSDMNIS